MQIEVGQTIKVIWHGEEKKVVVIAVKDGVVYFE